MKEYEAKSPEELRCEDYMAGRKTGGAAGATAAGGMFGGAAQQPAAGGLFGGGAATTQSGGLFGAQVSWLSAQMYNSSFVHFSSTLALVYLNDCSG